MEKDTVIELKNPVIVDELTALLRNGAKRVIAEAIETELESFLQEVSSSLADGKSRVVRNGYLPGRTILTGIGSLEIRVPRVRDRLDVADKINFKSSLIPPYMRRTATMDKVLPLLYLKGISEADFVEVLTPIFGSQTKNLSPCVISRLKASWEEEHARWSARPLTEEHYVYWWVDGIHFHARNDEKRCVLVVLGVNAQGEKKLIALTDGFRESTESWLCLLRALKARGLAAPVIAVGDGALGFWNAIDAVFPETKHQRCWFHKMGNVLDKLPISQQNNAKKRLQEIWMSATRKEANSAFDAFITEYGAKYPKATDCLEKDREALLTFYDFPAEHWVHLRTTNPIESVFATVRHRTYKAKGAFSCKTILTMAFKLMESAQKNWIRLRGFQQLDNVIKGVKFKDGNRVENDVLSLTSEQQNQAAA